MKGDIGHIVSRCSHVEYRGGILPTEKDDIQNVSSVVDDMLQEGVEATVIVRKNVSYQREITPAGGLNTTLVGHLSFLGAPKQAAEEPVVAPKRLRVTPKILTGNRVVTTVSACHRTGIPAEAVLTGAGLGEMVDSELREIVEEIYIFAELAPDQKVRSVSVLQENGRLVGFLGDDVNNTPALNEANMGISVDTAVNSTEDATNAVLSQKDLNVLE